MATHQGKIDGLMLGVGAGFDYYAENIKRAPMWMQKHNLEWVYRLVFVQRFSASRYLVEQCQSGECRCCVQIVRKLIRTRV